MRFGVTLPYTAEPGFTLGGAEDEKFPVGEAQYSANGASFAYGTTDRKKSSEIAFVLGSIDGALAEEHTERYSVGFDTGFERAGWFIAMRHATAWRASGNEGFHLDFALSHLLGLYSFSGNSRLESEQVGGYRYLSDWEEDTTGIAWRPVVALQPTIRLGAVDLIPFAGGSAFFSLSWSSWKVNQWEDVNYGPDCLDGCPDDDLNGELLFDWFVGFDINIWFSKKDSLSLSSMFKADTPANTGPVTELLVLYSIGL